MLLRSLSKLFFDKLNETVDFRNRNIIAKDWITGLWKFKGREENKAKHENRAVDIIWSNIEWVERKRTTI